MAMEGDVLGLKLAGVLSTSAVLAAELVGHNNSTSLASQFATLMCALAVASVFSAIGICLLLKFDPSFRGDADNSRGGR